MYEYDTCLDHGLEFIRLPSQNLDRSLGILLGLVYSVSFFKHHVETYKPMPITWTGNILQTYISLQRRMCSNSKF